MITSHAQLRMKQRRITEAQIKKVLAKGKQNQDDFGRSWIRRVEHCDLVVIVDIVQRDILTTWRIDRQGNKIR